MRLFFACWIPRDWAADLTKTTEELKKIDSDLKWVEPGLWHLTLAFLGEVPEDKLSILKQAGQSVSAVLPMLELIPDCFGSFGGKKARVFWLGFSGDIEPLAKAARTLQEDLEKYGFAFEGRDFVPHLTLARAREGWFIKPEMLAASKAKRTGVSFNLSQLALVKSSLSPRGPVYENVAVFSFGGET